MLKLIGCLVVGVGSLWSSRCWTPVPISHSQPGQFSGMMGIVIQQHLEDHRFSTFALWQVSLLTQQRSLMAKWPLAVCSSPGSVCRVYSFAFCCCYLAFLFSLMFIGSRAGVFYFYFYCDINLHTHVYFLLMVPILYFTVCTFCTSIKTQSQYQFWCFSSMCCSRISQQKRLISIIHLVPIHQ